MKSNLIRIYVQQYRNKNNEEKRIVETNVGSKIVLIQKHVGSTDVLKSKADIINLVTKFNPPFPNKSLVLKKSKSIAVDDSIHIRDEILQESQLKSSNDKPSESHIKNLSLPIIKISTDNRYRSTEESFYINVLLFFNNCIQ